MIGAGITSQLVYFDICSLIILSIIFYSMISRKVIVGNSNVTFALLGLCIFITTLFDTGNALFSNQINFIFSYKNYFVRYFFLYGYYIFRNITLPVYEIYLLVISGGISQFTKKKWLMFLFFLPYIILVSMTIANIFLHNVFYVNENYEYIRCHDAIYFYFIGIFYFVCGIVMLFRYRKVFPKDKYASLSTMLPFNIIAVIIQFTHPQYLVECFCTTATFILICFTVQRPEEKLDFRYGSYTLYSFKEDVLKHLTLKTSFSVILVGTKNYDVIKTILSQNDMEKFKRSFVETLKQQRKNFNYSGYIYYFGNGIFTVLSLRESKERNLLFAKEIQKGLEHGIKIEKANINTFASICVLNCPKDFPDFDSLSSFITKFQNFFSDVNDVIDLEKYSEHLNYKIKADLNDIISRGIKSHGFMIYYQPIYSVEKKKFISAEALIRLNDPKWGFVSPELFIAAAEKNGTILHIGKIVIEEVCKFIASPEFTELGLEYIEINLSVAQCLQTDLVEMISGLLKQYNVKPSQINLEITERENIYDQEIFIENLDKLRKLGISFSLDDYGTGYSNIRRIIQLPIKIVKMDKSFVDEYENSKMQSVIKNTVQMLKEINKEIVVEGVETKESYNEFSNLHCDFIQGYYFSKPLNQVDFINKVLEMNK